MKNNVNINSQFFSQNVFLSLIYFNFMGNGTEGTVYSQEAVLDIPTEVDTTQIPTLVSTINTLSEMIWEIPFFKSGREKQLIHLSKTCEDDYFDFHVHLASLGTYIDSLNGSEFKNHIDPEKIKLKLTEYNCQMIDDEAEIIELKEIFGIEDETVKFFQYRPLYSIDFLTLFLEDTIENLDLLDELRKIRRLRNNAFLVHEIGWKSELKAYAQLGIKYPIRDYTEAWNIIVQQFINFLTGLRNELYRIQDRMDEDE